MTEAKYKPGDRVRSVRFEGTDTVREAIRTGGQCALPYWYYYLTEHRGLFTEESLREGDKED